MTDITDLPKLALQWHRAGRRVAIAQVVETWGSAPRPVGSWLVIDGAGALEGSVSGGCVEAAVIVEAMDALEDGRPRVLDYGVSDDEAFAVGLACGGRIRVLIDPVGTTIPESLLEELVFLRKNKTPVAYQADLHGTARALVSLEAYPERFANDRSGVEEDGQTYIGVHNPPLRMVVVGAVHIAQRLVPMARACGYDPVIIDPRGAFGAADRFPGETINEDWPDEAMAALAPDTRTAVVTLTHDPKLDDPAILAALESPAFYIGCLGSTRTHAKRVARLQGVDLSRLHAPVGLNIGARSPAEIAVSIMAEVTERLRRP